MPSVNGALIDNKDDKIMQFYMIFVPFFSCLIEENAPGGGGFELFLPRGWGICPSKRFPRGFARGDGQA